MSEQNDSLKNIILEMKNKISGSITLFQLLILLDYYLKKLEEHGCSEECIEKNIKEVEEVTRELKRLSSCRLDLLDRVIKRDPRLTTINKHLRLIIELLQRECGQQTYFSSVIAQEAQETRAIEYEKVKPMIERKNVVGKYEILKVLGEGGMGIVWLARDLSESRLVAIKAPKITGVPLRDEINIKRVIIEATILRNLDHPNIVKFIDYFVEAQKPYLVMEYVEGDHLEKYADLVSGDEKNLIVFAKKLTDAVDHMHERNVVHRDIKPKNIYVTPTTPWNIKLLDFGTAKYFHSQLERGEAIFSPGGYTAPEQLKFMYSPQSDIWSIGAVLFYLITRQNPIVAMPDYPSLQAPPRVEDVLKNRDIDPKWIKVLKKAMDPDPVKRYLKASDMVKDLLGEKDLAERTVKPKLIVFGVEIPIEVERVVIGRLTQQIQSTTSERRGKVAIMVEGNNMYVYIEDENAYLSRLHAEIVYVDRAWYLRDLGSLNKTAILENGEWKLVYSAYKIPSKFVKLQKRSMISLGYDDKLGPYLVMTFIEGTEE